MKRATLWLFLCVVWLQAARAAEPVAVPLVTDPAPQIDGDLNEWTGRDRGALLALDRREQVTYGRAAWHEAADLSGWVRLGHDADHLYLACHVTDDVVSQTRTGTDIWRGDHVMLFLDFVQSGEAKDLIQIGLSPGSLRAGGMPPEVVIWKPEGLDPGAAVAAARSTADGYELEAAIPWKTLRVKPVAHQTFTFDVAFSDSDQPGKQETCLSFSTRPWNPASPKRLLRVGLADRAGRLPADAFREKSVKIAKGFIIEPRTEKEFAIQVDDAPEGLVPTLTFKARAVWPKVGGCIAGLYVDVNGKPVPMKALVGRPKVMDFVGGGQNAAWARGITLFYSTDFTSVEKGSYKPVGFKAHEYVLRLDDLIKPGKNTITFKNNLHFSWAAKKIQIAMAEVVLTWRAPSRFRPPKVYKPAPKGPLPVIEPDTRRRVDYQAAVLPGGALKVSWQGRSVTVTSRFSRPGGKWAELTAGKAVGVSDARAAADGFRAKAGALEIVRSFSKYDECILVRDTLTNHSDDILPVMIFHSTRPGPCEKLYVSGRPLRRKIGANSVAANPSVVVLGKESGIGMMAYDDVFRVHCLSSYDGKRAQLQDPGLALKPGTTYAQEWLIVPTEKPSYWAFVNALRRQFKTNFTIPGAFAFFPAPHKKHMNLPPEELGNFIDRKAARLVGVTTGYNYKGLFAHGPARRTETKIQGPTIAMLRKLRPESTVVAYFNCFDCARAEGDPEKWPECRALRPDGKELREGSPYVVHFPTLTNAYGKEMDVDVDWILNTIRADGFWWDMYNGYGWHYGEPWDGFSADVDSRTHALIRKKSSTALISWPWRRKTLDRLLGQGHTVIANGGPMLSSEYAYQFPRAAETASIGNLSWMHFYTPIALGDHITEKNEADCFRHMLKALDWGGLYYWYSSSVRPTRATLTSHMFPFTPIELHSGYLIGKERILTNRSGLFGWGDASEFEVHVYDRVGRKTDAVKVARVMKDGKAYAEVRLPEGYAAAIVRK